MLHFFILMICLMLGSCMLGPDYKEPQKPIAKNWPHVDASVKETPYRTVLWWKVFHDPNLTSLIQQGYQHNLSLQVAGVHVLQARAQLAQTVGQLYPQQQAMLGNYNYTRIGGTSLQNLLPPDFDTAALGFSAAWELDFWGKYRRSIQSNDAGFLASVAAYDNVLLTLVADIGKAYIKIRTDQEYIRVVRANIVVQQTGLRIAMARYHAGEVSLVDVEQAKAELAQTQASLPPYIHDVQVQKDALAVLLGTVPNNVDGLLQKNRHIPKTPQSIAVGIPKETLAKRPDVHEARLHALEQGAAIGAVKANLYPAFSLTGTFAFSSNNINGSSLVDLMNWSNLNVITGPSFSWPLLNYGQITNAVRAQDAAFQQALLKYLNVVLQAQQEVQDNISAYIEAKHAVYYLTQANSAATKSLQLAIIRYKEGETDFTPVLNAEQQVLSIQTSLVNAQGDIPLALVALYRSLGGGWQIRATHDVVPDEVKKEMAARTHWGTLLQQPNHLPPTTKKQQIQQLYLPKW